MSGVNDGAVLFKVADLSNILDSVFQELNQKQKLEWLHRNIVCALIMFFQL